MKTIGLIGGMSWESTVTYYQQINQAVKERLGGLHSAQILLYSVDFAEIEACQAAGEWERSGKILAGAAQSLERAGADFLLICTNTMHKVAPYLQQQVGIPLLHIADATGECLEQAGIRNVALLGTKYTMVQEFYKGRLTQRGICVLTPDEEEMDLVNRVIYEQLCLGVISEVSRKQFIRIIQALEGRGAQGVILGCTEIGLLIQQKHVSLPVFDTALIHARAAAQRAMEGA